MYNQVTLIGHLGNSPEMRYTPSGVPVAAFNMAVNKTWTDAASGERKEKTIWVRCSAWRKQAESVTQYLTKGSKVLVVGEIEEVRTYTNKNGEPGASLEITAQTVRFLDSRNANSEPASTSQAVQNAPGGESDVKFMEDSSIPF